MFAVVGTLILASTVVLFAWAYVQFRRPAPSRWTQWEAPAQAITLLITAGIAFGIGALGRFAVTFGTEQFGLAELAMMLAAMAAATLAVRHYRAQWRYLTGQEAPALVLAASTVGAAALPAAPANDPGPPPASPLMTILGRRKRQARRRAA